jgi:PAS domain S-box-containing protein
MKKAHRVIATALFGLCFLSHLTSRALFAETLTIEERHYLRDKGPIIFVSQSVYPPFEFVDQGGDHTGMCIELAQWMASELGFRARFTDTSFKDAQEAVLSGKADVLTSLFYSDKRDTAFDFTQTLFDVPASIFVAADRPDIKSLSDLNGKTIAMQKGDYALEFLQARKVAFNVAYATNFAEATDLVIAAKADAIIGDEQIVLYHLYSNRLTAHIRKVGEPLYIGRDCMATREGNRILMSILNKGLLKARESGLLDRITRKWLGTQYSPGITFLVKHKTLILILAGTSLLTLIFVWFWNIQLRREVDLRTRALSRSEGTLREAHARLEATLNALPDMLFEVGPKGRIIEYHAPESGSVFPESEAIVGRLIEEVFPPDAAAVFLKVIQEAARKGTSRGATYCLHTQDKLYWYELSAAIKKGEIEGVPDRLVALARDITERRHAEEARRANEERTRAALKEKEMLLREIHHRVKNSMQVVASLLNLQTDIMQDPRLANALKEAQTRVHSIALVHDLLYSSENLSRIDLKSYLELLSRYLSRVFVLPMHSTRISVGAGSIRVGIDQAIPCGLIATELLTNALKHAFPGKTDGQVGIDVVRADDGRAVMTICDNGVGLPRGFDPLAARTLGLRLVTELVEDQLEGQWKVDSDGGTRWSVRWPLGREADA